VYFYQNLSGPISKHLPIFTLTHSLPRVRYVWRCWLSIYVYKLITNYLLINYSYYQLLLITYMCFVYVQMKGVSQLITSW